MQISQKITEIKMAPAPGKITLIGIGPGSVEHMTKRATEAILEADTIIGYNTYIKLIADLIEGKEIIRKSMTEELDRAAEALKHAQQGKKVALVSSGDAGVYGMAGPTFEMLLQVGWKPPKPNEDGAPHGIEVEIVPGASAINACAALVGAPLTHDFCAISLSDLLTPWVNIARRLEAAASADFVLALYNPKSGRRTQHILEAQALLLRHRSPDTPVAIVKSAYRRRQDIQLTTLANMAECQIGMLSTVIIGNSNTFVQHGLMITPRGYSNKYHKTEGSEGKKTALSGEKAGRSLSRSGLSGWLRIIQEEHTSGVSTAKLAQLYKLPEDYIKRSLLITPEPSSKQ